MQRPGTPSRRSKATHVWYVPHAPMDPVSVNQSAVPLYSTRAAVALERAEEELVGRDAFAGATTRSAADFGRVVRPHVLATRTTITQVKGLQAPAMGKSPVS